MRQGRELSQAPLRLRHCERSTYQGQRHNTLLHAAPHLSPSQPNPPSPHRICSSPIIVVHDGMQLEKIVGNLKAQREEDKAKLGESNATLRRLKVQLRAAQKELKRHRKNEGKVQEALAKANLADRSAPSRKDLIARCTMLVRLLSPRSLAPACRCFSLILFSHYRLTCTARRLFTCAHKHHSGCWGR